MTASSWTTAAPPIARCGSRFQLTPAAHSRGVRQIRFFSALGCEQLESVTVVIVFENHCAREGTFSAADVEKPKGDLRGFPVLFGS